MDHHQIDRIAENLLAVVPQLHRLMTGEGRREGHRHASIPQLRLLAELLHGPQTMSVLARQQHVSTQAVYDLVHDMLERGWLSRVPHAHDRRQQLLCITEGGRIAFAEGREQALSHLIPHLEHMTDSERYVLAAALLTLQRVLEHGARNDDIHHERLERKHTHGP